MFSSIDKLKAELDSLRPLPKETLKSLRDATVLEWTYHSNAIEGNTLTLKETKEVLEGITIGGKSIREHLEAINHQKAIEFIEHKEAKREQLTYAIKEGVADYHAGNVSSSNNVYTRMRNKITGA